MNDGKLRSNCIVEALREFRRRVAVWRKNPQQHEPYLLMRPSRHPGGVVHVLVGELDPKTDTVKVESFKPSSRSSTHGGGRLCGSRVCG